jgi:hypothetical protein
VQNDGVPLFDEQFRRHTAEAVGGAGDEDASHGTFNRTRASKK